MIDCGFINLKVPKKVKSVSVLKPFFTLIFKFIDFTVVSSIS